MGTTLGDQASYLPQLLQVTAVRPVAYRAECPAPGFLAFEGKKSKCTLDLVGPCPLPASSSVHSLPLGPLGTMVEPFPMPCPGQKDGSRQEGVNSGGGGVPPALR